MKAILVFLVTLSLLDKAFANSEFRLEDFEGQYETISTDLPECEMNGGADIRLIDENDLFIEIFWKNSSSLKTRAKFENINTNRYHFSYSDLGATYYKKTSFDGHLLVEKTRQAPLGIWILSKEYNTLTKIKVLSKDLLEVSTNPFRDKFCTIERIY